MSKQPPTKILDFFLEQNKNTSGLRRIQTDLGSELAKSGEIQDIIHKHGYVLKTTAAELSFQNAIVERPHQALRNMMRSMLTGANLSNTFWADALLHAVYVKNCIPHHAIIVTPFQPFKGFRPNISHL